MQIWSDENLITKGAWHETGWRGGGGLGCVADSPRQCADQSIWGNGTFVALGVREAGVDVGGSEGADVVERGAAGGAVLCGWGNRGSRGVGREQRGEEKEFRRQRNGNGVRRAIGAGSKGVRSGSEFNIHHFIQHNVGYELNL